MLRVRRNSLVSLALLAETALAALVVVIAWRTAPPEKRPRADRSPDEASQCDAHCHWLLHQPRSVSAYQGRQLREQVAVPCLLSSSTSNADICMYVLTRWSSARPCRRRLPVPVYGTLMMMLRLTAMPLWDWRLGSPCAYTLEWVRVDIYSQRR